MPYFAIFDDGHHRRLPPRLAGGPYPYKTYAADLFGQSKPYASGPMKLGVEGPGLVSRCRAAL
jgi:hypothetical protein